MKFTEALCTLVLVASFSTQVLGQQGNKFGGNKFGGFGKGGQQGGNQGNQGGNQANQGGQQANQGGQQANQGGQQANQGGNQGNQGANNPLLLLQENVQSASNTNGQEGGAEAGQSPSKTDPANFHNFCSKKTKTNGAQVQGGSCNGVVMGDIPAKGNMVSAIIINPKNGDVIQSGTDINFQVKIRGLKAGSFTNPQTTYYSAPQALEGGTIVGHTHFTVQNIGALDSEDIPDPTIFDFFKGVNDAGNGGILSAIAAGGLKAGAYRCCTMTSASNHQPVLMPVAQRGPQDDCVRFTVSDNAGAANQGGNQGNQGGQQANQGGQQANQGGQQANQGGQKANQGGQQANQGGQKANQGGQQANQGGNGANQGGKGRNRFGQKGRNKNRSFAARPFIA